MTLSPGSGQADPAAPRPRRGWQVVALLVLICAALALLYHLRAIFTPLLVALLIAYIVDPVVSRLEKRGVPRVATILGVYAVMFGALALALAFGVPALIDQGAEFAHEVILGEKLTGDVNANGAFDEGDSYIDENGNGRWDPPRIARVLAWSQRRLKDITGSEDIGEQLRQLRSRMRGKEGDIAAALGKVAGTVLHAFTASLDGLITLVGFVFLVPVYLFFILKNMDAFWERVKIAIPGPYRERMLGTLGRIHRANASFFRGQLTVAAIEGTIVFVVLAASGVRFSFLFGVLYAAFALIPYAGVALSFAITALFVFLDAGFGTKMYITFGLFAFIQVLEAIVLQPLILGKETGLHPIAIILSVMIFGSLFGFFGLLLAVPLAAATIIVAEDYVLPFVRQVTEGSAP